MAGKGKNAKGNRAAQKPKTPPLVPEVQPSPIVEAPTPADHPDRGFDRVAILEPSANVPYRVLPPEKDIKHPEREKAQAQASKDQAAAAKAREEAKVDRLKDESTRTVKVRALRLGQYPADGSLKKPGDVFDYVIVRDKDGNLEEKLPSWMQHIDGKLETRSAGEPSPVLASETAKAPATQTRAANTPAKSRVS